MNASNTTNMTNATTGCERRRVVLSTLWIFAVLNYIYADIYTLFFNPVLQPEVTRRFAEGYAGDIQITQGFVLVTAILMETSIAMVLLSRLLPYRANRWANILSGGLHTLFVAWSLIGDTPNGFYVMFAAIEVACTLFIVGYAWKWSPAANEKERFHAVTLDGSELEGVR
jgi:Ni,Fe-hydrogenase I cytochrome b subunit